MFPLSLYFRFLLILDFTQCSVHNNITNLECTNIIFIFRQRSGFQENNTEYFLHPADPLRFRIKIYVFTKYYKSAIFQKRKVILALQLLFYTFFCLSHVGKSFIKRGLTFAQSSPLFCGPTLTLTLKVISKCNLCNFLKGNCLQQKQSF